MIQIGYNDMKIPTAAEVERVVRSKFDQALKADLPDDKTRKAEIAAIVRGSGEAIGKIVERAKAVKQAMK